MRIKAFLRWAWKWATVLTATIVGGALTLFPLVLTAFSAVDVTPLLAPFMEPEIALAVVTGIAVLKALYAVTQTARGKEAEG